MRGPPVISWFINPINYSYNPKAPGYLPTRVLTLPTRVLTLDPHDESLGPSGKQPDDPTGSRRVQRCPGVSFLPLLRSYSWSCL